MISNQTFMRIAYQVASESKAEKRKVGAVIVKDNNIIALGYNGTPSGFSNICETYQDGHEGNPFKIKDTSRSSSRRK